MLGPPIHQWSLVESKRVNDEMPPDMLVRLGTQDRFYTANRPTSSCLSSDLRHLRIEEISSCDMSPNAIRRDFRAGERKQSGAVRLCNRTIRCISAPQFQSLF
jgi:hypothetical protein